MKWQSPPQGTPKYNGCVAVRGDTYHKIITTTAIHTDGLEHLYGEDWELFSISHINDDFVWGSFIEGIGLIEVMVPKTQVRELTSLEKSKFNNRRMQMIGSHSGKVSYEFSLGNVSDPVAE